MKRHRPDPLQGLFRWVWSNPEDDRPDSPLDDDPPPPLRDRVARRGRPATRLLWGMSVKVAKAHEKAVAMVALVALAAGIVSGDLPPPSLTITGELLNLATSASLDPIPHEAEPYEDNWKPERRAERPKPG